MDWADKKAREVLHRTYYAEESVALALRRERERCAKIAENGEGVWGQYDNLAVAQMVAKDIASAIRSEEGES